MQFDWTTFVLEIINFLVLVWLLKHFFYQPVLNILDARKERVNAEITRSEQLKQKANELKNQYETRLDQWSKEREEARKQLEQELAQIKEESTENLKEVLATQEEKWHVKKAATKAGHKRELIKQVSSEAYENASAMLRQLASPELTISIIELFKKNLMTLPSVEKEALCKAAKAVSSDLKVEVASAHTLDDNHLSKISFALSEVIGQPININFTLYPELIAGLRVTVGECLLHVNLADELKFFRRQSQYA